MFGWKTVMSMALETNVSSRN